MDAKQTALLMSTQGLNTAQIQQTLATQGLTTTQQYQAMVEAGLLSSKKQLSNAELQNAIASAINSQSKAKEIMYSMGLSAATEGEEAQTVELTAKKLSLAAATGILTQAEIEQIAATTGVTLSQKTQNTQLTALTSKIKGFGNNIRNIGTGIHALAKAHPAIAAVTTIITVATTALGIYKKKQEETATAIREGYEEAKSAIKEAQNTLNSITSVVNKNKDRFLELSNGVNEFSERVSLSGEEYEEYLTISQELAEIAPSLVYGYDNQGRALLNIGSNAEETTAKLNELIETSQRAANQTYIDNLDKVADGIYQNVKTSQDKIATLNGELAQLEDVYERSFNNISSVFNSNAGQFTLDPALGQDYINALEKSLKEAGLEGVGISGNYVFYDSEEATEEQLNNAFSLYQQYVDNTFSAKQAKLKEDLAAEEKLLNDYYSQIFPNLQAWVKENEFYQSFLPNTQAFVETVIPQIDWETIDPKNSSDYTNYIEDNILNPLMYLDEETRGQLEEQFKNLLSFSEGDLDILPVARELQNELDMLGIQLDITPIIADEQASLSYLRNSLIDITTDIKGDRGNQTPDFAIDTKGLSLLEDYTKDFDQHQIEIWLRIYDASKSAQENIELYENELKRLASMSNDSFSDIFALEDVSDNQNTLGQLNSQLNDIQSAYQNLKDTMDSYSSTGSITIDQFQSIVEQGSHFLDYLELEDGQLSLNEQAMYDLTEARITAMKAQMIQSIVANVEKINNEAEANSYLASTNYELAESYEALAESKLDDWAASAIEAGMTETKVSAVLEKAYADINKINSLAVDLGNISTSTSAKNTAETDYAALLDKETSLLEKQLDANLITFSDYLDKRKSLLDDYYTAGKITAEEYYDGLSSLYESQLSSYDKVVNAVTNRIDKEIDTLEKQKEVIEESYQFKMDAVQAQIDALNKENETRKEQIALEQAQYEAERARNQRSVKQFVNGQFVYTADMNEVKAAEENLAEQEQQMEIFLLEDQIASLEQEMENATASLDNQISALEAYKEQWSEISSVYEEQQNALIAAEILGADWEAQVLSGRLATLQAFTNQYIALQQAQANAAAQATQTPTPPANNSNTGGQTTHAYYAMTRTGKTVTATPFSSSAEAWNWLVNTYGSLDAHQNYKVVQKYADGGVIGAQPGLLDFIAQAVNEDHLIAARQGERILTTSQNKQFEALVKLAPELLSMHHPLQNLSVPDSFRSLFTPASTPNITIGDIHLHNVNDVNSLSRAIIQRLPGQMMQAIHRH